ncbi:MAG: hypothetical protein ACR2FY_18770 [Pirellulaceae bacterium]
MAKEMKVAALGVAWYTPESYPLCRAVMLDGNEFPETYEEWLRRALQLEQATEQNGQLFVRAMIDPQQFPAWCTAHGHRPDRQGRIEFANVQARDAVLRGTRHGKESQQ